MLPAVSATNSGTSSGSNPPQMPASMAAAKMSVDFVNLYETLELAPTTDAGDIRKRISVMYLEAQKNQDHRNPQKKLFFQQMYEVYLPQARHLLLDPKRRNEYDAYLSSFKEDEVRSHVVQEALVADSASPAEARRLQEEERVLEETLTPEQLAERRAALWQRWEEGLKTMTGELAQLTFSPIELKARAIERKEYMERVMVEVVQEDKRREAARERQRLLEAAKREEEQQIARAAELTRRREEQFSEYSIRYTRSARIVWSAGSGIAVLLTGVSFLLVVLARLIDDSLAFTCLPLALVGAVFAGWRGGQHGAAQMQKTSERSRGLQKEAERRAVRVMDERRYKDGAKEMTPAAAEEAAALQIEIQEQAAALQRADIAELSVQYSSAVWAFSVTEVLLLIGCVVLYDLDYILRKTSSSTILVISVISWIGLILVCYSLWQGLQNQILNRFREKRAKEKKADKFRFQT